MTTQQMELPSNIYKPNSPFEATVLEIRKLTKEASPNDVEHIVLDISGSELRYVDGQSIGVLPPGEDANGRPHKLRLYSIASPHCGDDGEGKTVTVCVKRLIEKNEETGEVYHGVCSTFLCDLKVGDKVKITGPVGKHFVLPNTPDANLVMVATGTGIAPFRAFLKTRYNERAHEKGQCWLLFGAQTQNDFLYSEDYEIYNQKEGFNLVTAFSRETKNAEGGRMYVQHRLEEHCDTIFKLLQDPKTYFFMCGLRGMEPGVMEGMQKAAAKCDINWDDFLAKMKEEHRWLVEVY